MGRMSLPPPVCDTNLSQRLSFENNNNNNLREASFSSYLNHAEKEFVRKLAESARDRPSPTQEEDGDIEVFGAEKYFNGGMDNPNPLKLRPRRQQFKKAEQINLHQKKPKTKISRSGTPTVRSDSSWNSQNALLQNVRRNHSGPGESKKKNKSSPKSKGFLYKCCCCHNDSVEVDSSNNTKMNPKQQQQQPVRSGLNFTFQKSTSTLAEAKNLPLKMKIQVEQQQARRSIEVFGSSLIGGKPQNVETLSLNHLERRLSMLSWNDVGPRVKESDSNMSATDDSNLIDDEDTESDASSDLFEIESLRGNPNPFLVRQSSDCTDCVTPTTCYAPSEASIEWSVGTASAADYDERRLSTTSPVSGGAAYTIKSNYPNDAAEEIQRRRSNLLMGCRSKKAARDAYGSEAEVCRRSEPFGRMTRFEAETKVMGFVGPNSITRRYSPQMPNILYV